MNYLKKYALANDEYMVEMIKKSKVHLFWSWVGGILFVWVLLIPLFMAIKETIQFFATEYAVTNKKVIEKYGFFSTHYNELKLEKIENISIDKTLFGKLFHYGHVCVQGANNNDIQFHYICRPEQVKKSINGIAF